MWYKCCNNSFINECGALTEWRWKNTVLISHSTRQGLTLLAPLACLYEHVFNTDIAEKRPSCWRDAQSSHWIMFISCFPVDEHQREACTDEENSIFPTRRDGRSKSDPFRAPSPIRFGQYTAPLVAARAGSSPLISSGTESRSSQLGLLAGEAVFFAVR